jgi:hypothetical protein
MSIMRDRPSKIIATCYNCTIHETWVLIGLEGKVTEIPVHPLFFQLSSLMQEHCYFSTCPRNALTGGMEAERIYRNQRERVKKTRRKVVTDLVSSGGNRMLLERQLSPG